MTAFPRRPQHPAAARGRLLLLVAALLLLLLLQLFGAVGHDHDSEAQVQDCVACSVHAQSHAAPPTLRAQPAAFAWLPVRALGRSVVAARATAHPPYLLPQPHAPPAVLLPA